MAITGFNPRTGEWETGAIAPPALPPNVRSQTVSAAAYSTGADTPARSWSLNSAVSAIGDFIANAYNKLRNISTLVFTWGAWILGAIALISWMCDGHWIGGIIVGVLLGYAYVNVTAWLAAIASWLLFIPVAILRYIFYNLWTLLATLALAGFAIYENYEQSANSEPVETVVAVPSRYKCTANVLYVRSAPSVNAEIVGSLFRDTEVEVIDYFDSPGFARINFNGITAYVSTEYITQY